METPLGPQKAHTCHLLSRFDLRFISTAALLCYGEQIGLFQRRRPSIYPAITYFPITTCSGKKRERRESLVNPRSRRRRRPLLYHTPSSPSCSRLWRQTRFGGHFIGLRWRESLKRNINHNSLPFGVSLDLSHHIGHHLCLSAFPQRPASLEEKSGCKYLEWSADARLD